MDRIQEDNDGATARVNVGHMAMIQGFGGCERLWSDVGPPEYEEEHSSPDLERYELQDQYESIDPVGMEGHKHS